MDFNQEFIQMLQDVLLTIASGLLSILGGILLFYANKWIKNTIKKFEMSLSSQERQKVKEIIADAIRAVDMLKANGIISNTIEDDIATKAKEKAIQIIERELLDAGIVWDVERISDNLESVYKELKMGFTDEAELMDKAVDFVVNTYLISDFSDYTLEVAANLADKYLKDFGMSVDFEVLESAIASKAKNILDK